MMQRLVQRAVRKGALQRLPEAFKAPFRLFIRPEDIYDTELHKLGLEFINRDDMFVCSYPKSGNTWLRFIIANLLCPSETISFRNINSHVPYIEFSDRELNRARKRPPMKTHWPFLHRFPRTIYICRDPRDVYVSYFHYAVRRGWFRGDLTSFLRHGLFFVGDWCDHVEAALMERERRPSDVLFLKYEDMLAAPHESVNSVARFLGLEPEPSAVSDSVDKTSFVRLKENERTHGGEVVSADIGFFRRGIYGGWKDELSAADVEFIVGRNGGIMRRVGYA
jgi:estrone sulfotransferase